MKVQHRGLKFVVHLQYGYGQVAVFSDGLHEQLHLLCILLATKDC